MAPTDPTNNQPLNQARDQSLARRIERRLREQMPFDGVVAQGADGAIYLSGRVPSSRDRQQAEFLARKLARGAPVENDLNVERVLPEDRGAYAIQDLVQEPEVETVTGTLGPERQLDPLFTGQPLETNDLNAIGSDALDDDPDKEPDPVFFAPTDPVVHGGREGELEVLGGFDPTSMSCDDVDPSFEDNRVGDEALITAIQRELAEDATTTTFTIDVTVENGVARLRGQVGDLEDAENAEEVAGRVPGVRDVIDELTLEHG
jgi:osmotically-inducible protein OsmY